MRWIWPIFLALLCIDPTASYAAEPNYHSVITRLENQRAERGDSPVLIFNLGVAYYHLKMYENARIEFWKLRDNKKFKAISMYNIGLVERALRNFHAADQAFSLAENATKQKKLRKLIRSARNFGKKQKKHEGRLSPRQLGFKIKGSIGAGYDDNVYRTPDDNYIDYSRRSQPLVKPDRQASFYIPVRFSSKFNSQNSADAGWLSKFRFNANLYPFGNFDNADRIKSNLEIGRRTKLFSSGDYRHYLTLGPVLNLASANDTDRDDGIDRQLAGIDVSDRFSYFRTGFKTAWEIESPDTLLDFVGLVDRRKYGSNGTFGTYDQVNYSIKGRFSHKLNRRLKYSAAYQFGIRAFDERRARNALGSTNKANPARRYQEHLASTSVSFRPVRKWLFKAKYQWRHRNDTFVSYDNYQEHRIGLKAAHRINSNLRAAINIGWRDREYPHAFVFRNPAFGHRARSVLDTSVSLEQRVTKSIRLQARFDYHDDASKDPRYRYDRTMGSVNLFLRY